MTDKTTNMKTLFCIGLFVLFSMPAMVEAAESGARSGRIAAASAEQFALFYEAEREALASGRGFDSEAFKRTCLDFEKRWTDGSDRYAVDPAGDEVAVCRRLHERYRPLFE